jgi:small subunit ribosomal protein S2
VGFFISFAGWRRRMEKKEKKSKKTAKSAVKKVSKTVLSAGKIDVLELLEAGCHFGHRVSKTNPKIKPFLYTARDGVQIFDLFKTAEKMEQAGKFLAEVVSKGEKVLLLGTKRQSREFIRTAAKETGMPYVVDRWLGGTITNWDEIKKQINVFIKLKEDSQKGVYEKRTKAEQAEIKRSLYKSEQKFGGLAELKKLPKALFVVDISREHTAVKEAKTRGIPVVAIVDSNSNPTLVDYPIPANDDAKKSLELIIGWISKVIAKNSKGEKND